VFDSLAGNVGKWREKYINVNQLRKTPAMCMVYSRWLFQTDI